MRRLALALLVLVMAGCGGRVASDGRSVPQTAGGGGWQKADGRSQMADGGSFPLSPTPAPRPKTPTTPGHDTPAKQPPSAQALYEPDASVPTAPTLAASRQAFPRSVAPSSDERWIDVDLSKQQLIAYEGATPAQAFVISSGAPGYETVTGKFNIYAKYEVIDLYGPDFFQPSVPFVMMFYPHFALHAATWHDDFGQPVSRGCVNLRLEDAKWLYEWAAIGTRVEIVHWH